MSVLQSGLYQRLDDAERADCDELVRQNIEWLKADAGAPAAASALKEVELNIIRFWPDGMADRLEHVWKDVIGFIPNYKLYDLQRVLAEFGFVMKVYEQAPSAGVTASDAETFPRQPPTA